jgi:hypothetical protein
LGYTEITDYVAQYNEFTRLFVEKAKADKEAASQRSVDAFRRIGR